jgi:hypothetical protein
VLCYNPLQAEHDRQAREASLAHLKQRIERGQAKELLRNRLLARYLKHLRRVGAVARLEVEAVESGERIEIELPRSELGHLDLQEGSVVYYRPRRLERFAEVV